MPKLDGTGPEGKGTFSGRKSGKCLDLSAQEKLEKPGKGAGARRQTGGGEGKGKRFNSGKL